MNDSHATHSPWKTMWFHPRETVARIIGADASYGVTPLACLTGVGEAMARLQERAVAPSFLKLVLMAAVVGPLTGLLLLALTSVLVSWTGKWLGGRAPREHIKTAIAWSGVPAVVSLALFPVALVVFGDELFTVETPGIDDHTGLRIAFVVYRAVEFILGLWALVLLCQTIAEVQSYASAWRGFANVMLAVLVILIPLLIIVAPFLAL